MSTKKTYTGSQRVRKAYWTATVVMLSYGWLMLRGKIFGKGYYEKRILALHIRNAERVKKAILQLNGLFIKIGQMLSILSNFLPEAFQNLSRNSRIAFHPAHTAKCANAWNKNSAKPPNNALPASKKRQWLRHP